jgi:hypothetical protein
MLTLATTMSLMAEQRSDLQEEAGKIASAISVPFYGYDMGSVASVLETMLSDIDAVRAVEIFDSSSDSVIFKAYRTGAKTFISGESITEGRLQGLQQLIHPLAHEQEKIGELRLYYKPNGKDTLKLTAEERAWIKAHPELRVGNEMDWPPFDYDCWKNSRWVKLISCPPYMWMSSARPILPLPTAIFHSLPSS